MFSPPRTSGGFFVLTVKRNKSKNAYDRDNRATTINYDGGAHKVAYTYDELGRLKTRTAECGADAGKLTSTYEYVDGGYDTNSTTPLVKKIAQNGVSFEYEYDSRGNITSEKRGNLITTYQYDALGQLIRVNDPHENATWVYNYDRGGNILSKVKYAYTTDAVGTALETIPYVYGDSNWKDKLTSYNGQTITYDAIGNPLNDGTWTYTWQAGRQLKQMSAEGTSVSFKYDHNGMRTQKIVEQSWYPETTNYTYHGKLLTHMTVDYTDFDEVAHQDEMHFFYDAQSRPVKVEFNGTVYTYLPNLQGDIVGILDSNGSLVVEYKYDAWGKPLSTAGTLADTLGKRNPFRYRGDVFDEEIGLCYLQNRYYNLDWQRFINVDEVLGKEGTLLNHNPIIYCSNNPIISIDTAGNFLDTIFDVFSLGASIVEVISNPTDPWNWIGLAGDIIDLVPGVTGVGEITRGVRGATKIVSEADNVIDGAKALRKAAETTYSIRKSTGSYEIIFKSGTNYVGKGGYKRAIVSATTRQIMYKDEVVSISWKAANTTQDAFVDEYMRMMRRGVRNTNTYNKIWSPGEKNISKFIK